MNRPTSSRSHEGAHDGKHTGSERTSKGSAHFLDHIIQRKETGYENIALNSHLQI